MAIAQTDVAILGLACIYPGAGDAATFWRNIRAGYDAIAEIPPARWERRFYDPSSGAIDRLYCKRAGFVDDFADFDAIRFGVMPIAAQSGEPDQLLALEVAAKALEDAGYGSGNFDRENCGVILGRGGYFNSGIARLAQRVRTGPELIDNLRRLLPQVGEAVLEQIRAELGVKAGHHGPDTVIGLVPNLAASRIANRLDLNGPSYTIDGACASSLLAVDRACSDLLSHRADLMLAGGVHICHDVTFWTVFCQLGALSRSQQIRPFDQRADGILMGEGVGLVVLKRLADAERDGDRILAVVKGTGTSSDGRATSLMTPAVKGQELALRRAWNAAGLDPRAPHALGLVEAHGTATPAGDQAELETLARFFGPAIPSVPRAGLGSVKSMIGHAMPAAGMAGLIKATMALHHRVLPPTLHCEQPDPALQATRFRIIQTAEPWETPAPLRRAGVNAFGFGGINAHVVLEEYRGTTTRTAVAVPKAQTERVWLRAAASPQELLSSLTLDAGSGGEGPCRIAVFEPDAAALAKARTIVGRGAPFRDRTGAMFFTPHGLLHDGGKLAFVFPGVDAEFQPRIADVTEHFARPPLPAIEAAELERQGVGIILVNRLLHEVLGELGIRPDLVAGHSIGEWSAMIAAGVLEGPAVDAFLGDLRPHSLEVPGVRFAALGCGAAKALQLVAGLPDVHLSHDNCPHQAVLCGPDEQIDQAVARLRSQGVLCQKLDFRSGFHSPWLRDYLLPMQADIDRLAVRAPRVPLWSATTCAPYPDDPAAIRTLFVEHLVKPVRFRELTQALYDTGARVLVQCGTGSLVGLMDDTLGARHHLAFAANVPKRGGMAQLRRLVAALWVEGARLEPTKILDVIPARRTGASRPPLRLALGAPLLVVESRFALHGAEVAPALPAGEPLLAQASANLAAFAQNQHDVLAAWKRRSAPPPPLPVPERQSLTPRSHQAIWRISLATHPELVDHCFFRQPAGWPEPGDGFPVMPMTGSLAHMQAIAAQLVPELRVVAIERVRAFRWLACPEPLDVKVIAEFDGKDALVVRFDGFIEATLRLAPAWVTPPPPQVTPCQEEQPTPMTATELYAKRWMFHGPAYRGVVELNGIGPDGIRGVIQNLPTPGALLDNAGQLMGLWVSITSERDKMAMPVMVERIAFFGPPPPVDARLPCRVWIRRDTSKQVRADMELLHDGQVSCRIEGWEDRRFESDARTWAVKRDPETHLLAFPVEDVAGLYRLPRLIKTQRMLDYMARRYLTNAEIRQYQTFKGDRQVQWLFGRICAKDAVRGLLWQAGAGPIFPIEIEIVVESGGRPRPHGAFCQDLTLSIAHKGELAVALAARGRAAGVDLETIAPRDAGFLALAFTSVELALLPAPERDVWVARFWAAKEAVAKARGTGFQGNPKRYAVNAIDGERLCVDGDWVATRRDGDAVVAWTV